MKPKKKGRKDGRGRGSSSTYLRELKIRPNAAKLSSIHFAPTNMVKLSFWDKEKDGHRWPYIQQRDGGK